MRALLVLGSLAGLAAAAAPAAAATSEPAPAQRRLSDERTRTTWANPDERATVRAGASATARAITRLRYFTEDGFDEVYLLLGSVADADGRTWVQLRLPGRPNGRVGWVRREALGPFRVVRTRFVVDRRRLLAAYYVRGRRVWGAPVGVGKPSTPTPAGRFWVRERFRLRPGSPYGPYAFGTSAYSSLSEWPGGGVVGIHGDFFRPDLIPGRPSHGCVRLRNRDVAWLGRRMPIGTPVLVR